jgi:hypothetical protein
MKLDEATKSATGLTALLLLAAGCGTTPALERFEAARIIMNQESFRRPQMIRVASSVESDCATARVNADRWRQFEELGLVSVAELRESGTGKAVCRATPSEEVRREMQTWAGPERFRINGGGEPWEIPVATRNFLRIDEMRESNGPSYEVEFAWQWQPNKIGERLGLETQPQPASARLWLYESGWHVTNLTFGGER